ncbi:MAG: Shedu anti-phage system protein SduA domain-containing protein [Salinarimonas sp.]
MPRLDPAPRLDRQAAHRQLVHLRTWLGDRDGFSEGQAARHLRQLSHLVPLIGMYGGNGYPARHAFEVALAGLFRADYVAGEPGPIGRFVLVEFEPGEPFSLFSRGGTRQMRRWGRHLERGLSQIADWSWLKNDQQKAPTYRAAFESSYMTETYVLVCGRGRGHADLELSRLHWRGSKSAIAGDPILIQTWDDLADHFERMLRLLDG